LGPPGAQTGRRGDAETVREVLGATPSPTAFSLPSVVLVPQSPFRRGGGGDILPQAIVSSYGVKTMTLTVEAIYENGVLKPALPLPLKERDRVQLTIETPPLDILQCEGILGWKGTSEELAPFALDPEFEYPPEPEES
jgi:predicted DNA-binding antitoxin AbrB/MazE fold protein